MRSRAAMPSELLFKSAYLNPFVIAIVADAFTVVCAAPAKVDESVEVDNEPSSSSSNSASRNGSQESSNEYANWGQPYFFASLVFFACAIAWAIFDSRRRRKKRSTADATSDRKEREESKQEERRTSRRNRNRSKKSSHGGDEDDEENKPDGGVRNRENNGIHHHDEPEGNWFDPRMRGAHDAHQFNAHILSSKEPRKNDLNMQREGGYDASNFIGDNGHGVPVHHGKAESLEMAPGPMESASVKPPHSRRYRKKDEEDTTDEGMNPGRRRRDLRAGDRPRRKDGDEHDPDATDVMETNDDDVRNANRKREKKERKREEKERKRKEKERKLEKEERKGASARYAANNVVKDSSNGDISIIHWTQNEAALRAQNERDADERYHRQLRSERKGMESDNRRTRRQPEAANAHSSGEDSDSERVTSYNRGRSFGSTNISRWAPKALTISAFANVKWIQLYFRSRILDRRVAPWS